MRRLVILGSTGSIGRQTLEVAGALPGLRVVGLAAGRRTDELQRQAVSCGAGAIAVAADGWPSAARRATSGVRLFRGPDAMLDLVEWAAEGAVEAGEALTVVNGVVGAAGLRATIASLEAGVTVALANKESLVAGGHLVLAAAERGGGTIIPVDSEHSALFQCILAARPGDSTSPRRPVAATGRLNELEELVLTGSGGPFRGYSRVRLAAVSPVEALHHPTWTMGRKISIDSATLMNKGLEVIEAHYLFGIPYERIRVLIQPQSLVHSLVRLADGSVLAHLGQPDMRTPIGYALSYPRRAPLPMVAGLDLAGCVLGFEEPDATAFRCLALARAAGERGGSAPAALNAANEVAVQAYLDGHVGFLGIEAVVEGTLERLEQTTVGTLDRVLAVDEEARRLATEEISRLARS